MSNPRDINVTVTVDTVNITDQNKNCMVEFSDDLGDPLGPVCDPANFISSVYKNTKITWTAVAKNGTAQVFFQDVKHKSGKQIMQTIKRGNDHNVFTAKVRNGNFSSTDEEKYNIIIGLAGYEGMAGSNENGPIVYLGNLVAYMNSYQNNVWYTIAEAPFEIEGISGYNTEGPIIYSGNRVAYMNGYNSNSWTELPLAPFVIEGIAGNNNSKGVLAYSGNRVAYLHYNASSTWVEVANAPFVIEGITGDYYGGPIVYAGNQVAMMTNYASNIWTMAPNAPINIEGISGTHGNGTVIYAGNQVYRSNNGVWTQVANAPFDIEGIAGNSVRGPIVFSGPQVQYMSDYNENAWHAIAAMPFNTRSFEIDPKLQIRKN